MTKSILPKSLRKYLRNKKAEIRREILDVEKQNEKIKELYKQIKRDKAKSIKR
jgi:hypothetical protein